LKCLGQKVGGPTKTTLKNLGENLTMAKKIKEKIKNTHGILQQRRTWTRNAKEVLEGKSMGAQTNP